MLKKILYLIFLVLLISFSTIQCSELKPCDISILFETRQTVERGGWQEIYFIPFSNEFQGCTELITLPAEQLVELSETNATIPITTAVLTGNDFSRLKTNRYYIVVRAKDTKCNLQWERCKDVDLSTQCITTLEIDLKEKETPENCDGMCVQGKCEVVACENNQTCINDNICDGNEYCGVDNICHSGDVTPNGTDCNIDNALEEICFAGQCVQRRCGDGYIDLEKGEQCDPPGVRNCDESCKFINGIDAGIDLNTNDSNADSDVENDITLDKEQDIANDLLPDIAKDIAQDLFSDTAEDIAQDLFSDTTEDIAQDLLIDTNNCIDNDGDNYGENCASGPDCDDTTINCTDNCDVDIDNDQIPDCKDLCINCGMCPENAYEIGFYDPADNVFGVDVEGSYAYITYLESGGLGIIDISDVQNPVEVGFYDTPSYSRRLSVKDDYAYVPAYGYLKLIDISNKTAPSEASSFDLMGVDGYDVYIEGRYAYIGYSVSSYGGGLIIIDVINPSNPNEVGYYDNVNHSVYGVFVSGSYAFITDMESGLKIIDISDRTNPVEVGSYTTPHESIDVSVEGNYAYVIDWESGLRIIDISNVSAPSEVSYYDISGNENGLSVDSGYAFIAAGNNGLRIVDISNPLSPVQVGFYNTPGNSYDVNVNGSYAFVADYGGGLRIINLACE